jgi:hypothetical protein
MTATTIDHPLAPHDAALPRLDRATTARLAAHCLGRVATLLWRGQLHLHLERIGDTVETDDGRPFVIYRDSSSGETGPGAPDDGALLAVTMWFRLRWVPPGARVRAFLFERESILNTLLYAGFEGYRTKLWTADHRTNDYAGFYTWGGREEAERYLAYAMTMLRPLSVPGTLGGAIHEGPLPAWAERSEALRAGRATGPPSAVPGGPGRGSVQPRQLHRSAAFR